MPEPPLPWPLPGSESDALGPGKLGLASGAGRWPPESEVPDLSPPDCEKPASPGALGPADALPASPEAPGPAGTLPASPEAPGPADTLPASPEAPDLPASPEAPGSAGTLPASPVVPGPPGVAPPPPLPAGISAAGGKPPAGGGDETTASRGLSPGLSATGGTATWSAPWARAAPTSAAVGMGAPGSPLTVAAACCCTVLRASSLSIMEALPTGTPGSAVCEVAVQARSLSSLPRAASTSTPGSGGTRPLAQPELSRGTGFPLASSIMLTFWALRPSALLASSPACFGARDGWIDEVKPSWPSWSVSAACSASRIDRVRTCICRACCSSLSLSVGLSRISSISR